MEGSKIRGASNTTILVALAAVGILFFIVIRIGPIFWNQKSLQSSLDGMTVADIVKMQRADVITSIIQAGQDAGVMLTEDQITVEYGPDENKVTIKVKYTASADLIITKYTREFEIVSNPIGSPKESRVRQQVGAPATSPQPPPTSGPAPAPYVAPPGGPYAGRARDAGKKVGEGGEP